MIGAIIHGWVGLDSAMAYLVVVMVIVVVMVMHVSAKPFIHMERVG